MATDLAKAIRQGQVREEDLLAVLQEMLTKPAPTDRRGVDANRKLSKAVEALLSTHRPASCADLLLTQLASNPNHRAWVCTLLGKVGDPKAVSELIAFIDDDALSVRRSAVFALRDIGDPQAVGPLREQYDRLAAESSPDPNTLNPLLWTLRSLGEEVEPWYERFRQR